MRLCLTYNGSQYSIKFMKKPKEEIQELLDQGHTQAALAKACKVSQTTISRWANGVTKKISFMHMGRIRQFAEKQKGKKQ